MLTSSLSVALFSSSFYNARSLPRDGTAHHGLGPPTPTLSQENAHPDLPTGQSDEGNFLADDPSPQVTLVCVKSTETNQCGPICRNCIS